MKIKVLHWNILAKSLVDGFDGVNAEHLTWNYRLPLVVNKIKKFSPDIFALQEVELDQYADLKKEFPDYLGVYTQKVGEIERSDCNAKDDNQIRDDNHGCATFVNSKNFIIHKGGWEKLEGSQIFSYVILSSKLNYEPFLFGACHLKAKPGFESIRKEQVEDIYFCVNELQYYQHIIVGDFNDTPYSECVEIMRNKGYDMYHPEFTTHKSRNNQVVKRVIDYIFYKGITIGEKYETQPKELLPNKDFPSDHVPLVAEFEI